MKEDVYESRNIVGTASFFDRKFAQSLMGTFGEKNVILEQVLVIMSQYLRAGYFCVSRQQIEEELPVHLLSQKIEVIKSNYWNILCTESSVLGTLQEIKPLLYDNKNHKFYFHKYWHYQKIVQENFLQRIATKKELSSQDDEYRKNFFEKDILLQQITKKILENSLTVITGGPGTGKTYCIAQIIRFLRSIPTQKIKQITIAAFTGKAVFRIKETLEKNDIYQQKITITTLHSLLEFQFPLQYFKRNKQKPLEADIIIIDESSMVSLPLMSKICEAALPETQLVLLGDVHQLPAVDIGSFFYDFYHALEKQDVHQHNFVQLKKNYRFSKAPHIALAAEYILHQKQEKFFDLLTQNTPEIQWQNITHYDVALNYIKQWGETLYKKLSLLHSQEDVFFFFKNNIILCALRHGPYGSISINKHMNDTFQHQSELTDEDQTVPYQPIIITANNYQLKVYNSETGISIDNEGKNTILLQKEQVIKSYSTALINDYEDAYAITIHKSQGSEFDNIVVCLSDQYSPIMTKQLLYTAVTRCRKKLTILSSKEVLQKIFTTEYIYTTGFNDHFHC